MVGRRIGHFDILEKIGAGGMGEVYRARDTRLDRDVALKVLPEGVAGDRDSLARFEREAKAVARLSHPNILAIHEFGIEEGTAYVVTELLVGETLRDRIRRGPLPAHRVLDMALELADALAAAHGQGVIHRDLKPENIFLTSNGRAKILDFGLARVVPDSTAGGRAKPASGTLTVPGTWIGTPGYMSPEQVLAREVDARSDFFSLGSLLFEALTARAPFTRDTVPETMAAILRDEPTGLAGVEGGVPPGLERIVRHCLEKEPVRRFASAKDLRLALESIRLAPGGEETGGKSIAVLPFMNMSADPENDYFSDGVTEEIINALAQLPGLRVAARTSSFSFKGTREDLRSVGEKLGVGSVLEGSVRKAGTRIRITAQLIDAGNGYHLWSERYDRELTDVFALQDEIATAIARKLEVTLRAGSERRLARPSTEHLEAYDLYLKGRFVLAERTEESFWRGLALFEQAAAADPNFALAHTGIADTLGLLSLYGVVRPHDVMPRARAAAERAIELDDSLAEAHSALAFALWSYAWDWAGAAHEYRRALDLNPSYATARIYYGWYVLVCVEDRVEEGFAHLRHAVELDPFGMVPLLMLAIASYYEGSREGVGEPVEAMLARQPGSWLVHRATGLLLLGKGRHAEALAALERALETSGRNSWTLIDLGIAKAVTGDSEGALALARELEERSRTRYQQFFGLTAILASLGRTEEALGYLERAFEERDGILIVIRKWPALVSLRDLPRYRAVVRAMGLRPPADV